MKKRLQLILMVYGLFMGFTASSQSYCIPGGIGNQWCNAGVCEIDDVTLGSFTDLNSGCNSGNIYGYSDLTSSVVYAPVGQNLTFTVASTGTPYWGIWIDFNGDKDFDDAGETVYTSTSGSATITGSINIPASTSLMTSRIRIRAQSGSSNLTDPCYIPFNNEVQDYSITFTAAGGCNTASNLTASNILASSADLSWDSVGTAYNVEWGTMGFTLGSGTTINTTTNSTSLSSLNSNTYYSYYVQTDCSSQSSADSSAWVGPYTFLTPCVSVTSFPYFENFDGNTWGPSKSWSYVDTIDGCWSRDPDENSYGHRWIVRTGTTSGSPNTGPITDKSGTGNYVYAEASQNGSGIGYLTSPVFDVSGMTSPWLEFYYHMYGSSMGTLVVEASSDGGTNWTAIDSLIGQQQSASADPWAPMYVDLAAFKSSTMMVRFKSVRNSSYGDAAIDEMTIEEAPSCRPITGISFSNVTGSSLDLSFNGTSNKYLVEYGPEGFVQGTGTKLNLTTTTTTVTGLASYSTYDFYFQQDCSGSANGNSIWVGPYQMKTVRIPDWQEDFVTFPPSLEWSRARGAAANPTVFTSDYSSWGKDGWLNNGYDGAVRISFNTYATHDSWFFTPQIDLVSGSSYELYLMMAITGSGTSAPTAMQSDDSLLVVVSTDYGATWNRANTVLKAHDATGLNNYGNEYSASLSAYTGVVQFGVYYESTVANTSSGDFFVDYMGVRELGSCPKPTNVSISNIGANSADVSWDGVDSASSYSVEIVPFGFAQGSGAVTTGITTTSTTVSNLTATTKYDVYVWSDCGNGDSSFSAGPVTFLSGCEPYHATPYSTDFEITSGSYPASGTFENCWWVTSTSEQVYHWRSQKAPFNSYKTGAKYDNTTGVDGGTYIRIEAGKTGSKDELVGGPFVLTSLTQPSLSFYYHRYGENVGDLHVDVSLDNMNWDEDLFVITGETHTSATDAWSKAEVLLSDYVNDTVYIKFRGTYGTGSYGDYGIDDVSIDEVSGCLAPQAIKAENVTTTSADISWMTYASKSTIEYDVCGFQQGSGNGTIVHVNGNSTTLSNLTPATCYDVYLKDTCDLTNNAWVGPYSFFTECVGKMSGTYTVRGAAGPKNFDDFSTAISTLQTCGVNGPVTFDMSNASDTGYFVVSEIAGASAANSIVFDGKGTGGLYSFGTRLLEFDGATWMEFKGLTLDCSSNNAEMPIWIHNNTHDIEISDCDVLADRTNTGYNDAAIGVSFLSNKASSQGDNGYNLNINNCLIDGQNTGISVYGLSSQHAKNVTIENCTFTNHRYAIQTYYVDSVTIKGNHGSDYTSTYTGYLLRATEGRNIEVDGNFTVSPGRSITVNKYNQGVSDKGLITNNMLNGGLSVEYSDSMKVYNNTVKSLGSEYPARNYYAVATQFVNNIFISENQVAFYEYPADSTDFEDNNIYEIGASYSNVARIGSSYYKDLAEWKTAEPLNNVNAKQGMPIFVSSTDLHVLDALANDAGDNSVAPATDFDGETRPMAPSTTVDIGADEYTPKMDDASISTILRPAKGCGDSSSIVEVIIRNNGVNSITSLPVTATITGDIMATVSGTYTGSIAIGEEDAFVIGTANLFGGGTIDVKAYSSQIGDEDNSNDTAYSMGVEVVPGMPSYLMPDTICANEDSATFYASVTPGMTYGWYANQNDTTPVAVGEEFTFSLKGQTDYYLGYVSSGTKNLSTAGFPSGVNLRSGGNMLDYKAKKEVEITGINIESAEVAGDTTTVEFYYILDGSYVGLESTSSAWTMHDSVQVVSAGQGANTLVTFSTPIHLAVGQRIALYAYHTGYVTGAITPVSDANGTIEKASAMSSFFAYPSSSYDSGFEIITEEVTCSDHKAFVELPINADTAIADFNPNVSQPNKVDVDASNSQGHLVAWDLGDGTTASGVYYSHIYAAGGDYTITCIVTDTVCGTIDTMTKVVNMTIGIDESLLAQSLTVYPNPNNGSFNVSFEMEQNASAEIRVLDAVGREVYVKDLGKVSAHNEAIDLSNHSKGLYIVQIVTDNNTVNKKVTVQ